MAHVCVIGLQGDALSFHPHVPPPPFPPGLALHIFLRTCWWNSKILICKKTLNICIYYCWTDLFYFIYEINSYCPQGMQRTKNRAIKVIIILAFCCEMKPLKCAILIFTAVKTIRHSVFYKKQRKKQLFTLLLYFS